MSYTITKAVRTDVPQIVALVNSAYRGESAKQGWTSESHLLEGIRVDEPEMESYFDRPSFTLLKYADENNHIDAFVNLELVANDRLYLGMLTVNPISQAGGIGRLLLAAADDVARGLGCKAVKISVITSRAELIAWYERRGFVATGETYPLVTEKSVARVPVTLMVMEKALY